MHSVEENGRNCTSSTDCDFGSICNFDNTISGFCESCQGLESYQDCDNATFITEEGTTECKLFCVVDPGEFQ